LIAVTACAHATIAMSSVAKDGVTCVAAATCFVIVFKTCFCDVVGKEKASDYPDIIAMPK
jgi:Mg2+/Co2+ transporter CorB